MSKRAILVLAVLVLVGMSSCSGPGRPTVLVRNERATKANVQFKDVFDHTININDVVGGSTSAPLEIEPGPYSVTAVIQSESVSPSILLTAAREQTYTIVILSGATPALRVEGPLQPTPGQIDP